MRTLLAAVLVGAVACAGGDRGDVTSTEAPRTFPVSSPSFDDGGDVPVEHTCDGPDTPPSLEWEAPPAGAAELIVVVDDPDAPGGTFVHWLVAGLPAEAGMVARGLPAGAVEGRNSFGDAGWKGPCPPRGDDPHTYRFRVLAVDAATGLGQGFTAEQLSDAIADHLVAEGVHAGRYGR